MIFSVFVYLTFLVSLVFCGRYQNYRIKFFDNPIPSTGILLILIYTLVVGLRYDVGVDYLLYKYNPQIQISAESETKRSIFREKDKTKRSKKESAQHSKSRNKSFVMTSVSAL
jgi:hypothetical protein